MKCLECNSPLEGGRELYALKLELFCAAQPLEISEEELACVEAELRRLLQLAESLSEKQAREQQARIFTRRFYPLCRGCRDRIFRDLFLGTSNGPEQ